MAVGEKQFRIQDILLHVKDKSNLTDEENAFIAFPYTKYENVLGRPRVAESTQNIFGAPFILVTSMQDDMDEEEYVRMFGHIS
ncbi:MAG TPA: hypothetical protein DCW90_07205 [Lachnospiraceae bacterium]|nr:hypothetical protein [Lachnospiraceae bacterium]